VTLSGGEVMAQPDFAECFLDLCRKHFVHTAIETCLSASLDTVRRIADKTDFIHFDLKAMDPAMHLKLTGLDNGDILENAAYLLKSAKSLVVRFPMIPGLNDGLDNIESLGRFLAAHRKGVTLEILPYHRMGIGRYGSLGRKYLLQDIIPPEEGRISRVAEILSRYQIKVIRQ
jgi:pyruvate formate lyase activating enzyme